MYNYNINNEKIRMMHDAWVNNENENITCVGGEWFTIYFGEIIHVQDINSMTTFLNTWDELFIYL